MFLHQLAHNLMTASFCSQKYPPLRQGVDRAIVDMIGMNIELLSKLAKRLLPTNGVS